MSTVHDNGRTGGVPDLRELVDLAGATAASAAALAAAAALAGNELDGCVGHPSTLLFGVAGDAREAHWYLTRALQDLRELV